jgi:hypothetical protein
VRKFVKCVTDVVVEISMHFRPAGAESDPSDAGLMFGVDLMAKHAFSRAPKRIMIVPQMAFLIWGMLAGIGFTIVGGMLLSFLLRLNPPILKVRFSCLFNCRGSALPASGWCVGFAV